MSNEQHRAGVSEAYLVVRHLKLENVTVDNIQAVITEINQLYGMDDITFDEKSQVINLAYDAARLSIEGMEVIFQKHGLKIGHDWWTRFKKSYYSFVDENVHDNANHVHVCCNQVTAKKK